ncbi:hypothetical protein BRARA_D01127 [Brassica rapa]|uniref:Uncharacterized protein n=1 Tax=Brassica campestris TaxID=3711 RepID=A0A397ZK00_BRACM|nr:hypothetical protein BRARA_D01127 [Brassica rapa]
MAVFYVDSLCTQVEILEGLYHLATCTREGHRYCHSIKIGIPTPENNTPIGRRETRQTLDQSPLIFSAKS